MSTTGYALSLIQLVNVWSSQEARKPPETSDEIREGVAQTQLHLVAPETSSILPARNILPLSSRLPCPENTTMTWRVPSIPRRILKRGKILNMTDTVQEKKNDEDLKITDTAKHRT